MTFSWLLTRPNISRHEASLVEADGFPFGPEGTAWAVVNAHWWAQWKDYSRIGSEVTVVRRIDKVEEAGGGGRLPSKGDVVHDAISWQDKDIYTHAVREY